MFMVSATQTAYSAVGLTDLEGKRVHFSDYVPADQVACGDDLVLELPHMRAQEMAGQAQLHDRHQGGRLTVLGISMDGAEGIMEAWAFAEEHGARFPNLIGEGPDVAQFFHEQTGQSLQGTPTFLVYAPGGRLKAVQAGAVPPEGIEAFIADQEGAGG